MGAGGGKAFVGWGLPQRLPTEQNPEHAGRPLAHRAAGDAPPSREGPGCLVSARSQALLLELNGHMMLGEVGGEAELQSMKRGPRRIWKVGASLCCPGKLHTHVPVLLEQAGFSPP